MTIKDLVFENFGVDLPIKGGSGNSIETPIILERKGLNNYVATEYEILKYLGMLNEIDWRIVRQGLVSQNGRMIDKIKIETKKNIENKVTTQIEAYYFDFTECVKK